MSSVFIVETANKQVIHLIVSGQLCTTTESATKEYANWYKL